MSDHALALVPFLEDNQGLCSLLALGVALTAFVIENGRANRAELHEKGEAAREEIRRREAVEEVERERKREFIDAALAIVDRAIQITGRAHDEYVAIYAANPLGSDGRVVQEWLEDLRRAHDSIQ